MEKRFEKIADIKNVVSEIYCQHKHKFRSLTSGRTPVLLLDGKRGIDPSSGLSTVVKQILYSYQNKYNCT